MTDTDATQPNVAYCQIAPMVGGSDGVSPMAQITGFIMRPDSTLMEMGANTQTYQFTVWIPFRYGTSLQALASEVLPALQQGYSMPGLQAEIEFVPFV